MDKDKPDFELRISWGFMKDVACVVGSYVLAKKAYRKIFRKR